MQDNKDGVDKAQGPTDTEHVDAEKIGGVAPVTDWGRVERMDTDAADDNADSEDRSGTPKRSA